MVAGIGIGKSLPGVIDSLRRLEFGAGRSQINAPIAALIWLMIVPMMKKVDFASIRNVGRRPKGLLETLFVNWLVKPFSMALIAWLVRCPAPFHAPPCVSAGAPPGHWHPFVSR